MPAVAEPVPGFSLADFSGPGAPADDAVPVPTNTPLPGAPPPTEGTVPEKPVETPTPEKPGEDEPEIPERPEDDPTDNKKDDEDDDSDRTLESEIAEPAEVAKKQKAKEEAEAKKKADDEAAAAEKAEKEGKAAGRDDDLVPEIGPHVHQKTRKIITDFQAKAKAARDERDAVVAEREALKKERDELAQKAQTIKVPKEAEEELKSLRERVRELDISKDPALEAKYDRRIATNQTRITDILKNQGYGAHKEGDKIVENPKAISELVKSGLTLKNLAPIIAKLDAAELVEEADEIRESLRENLRLAREKQAEIESWKGDYEKRQEQRQQLTQQQQEQRSASFRAETDKVLGADLSTLAKDFPFVNQPPSPLPSDPPAVAKAKQAAIDEFNAANPRIEAAVKAFNPAGVAPEKQAEAVGRLNAAAIQAVIIKERVIPRMIRERNELTARNKELEAKIAKYENAGKLSRAHSAPSTDNGNSGRPEPQDLGDALGSGPGS